MFTNKIQITPCSLFVTVFILALCTGIIVLYIIGPIFNLAGNFGGQGHDGYIELARNIVRGEGYVFEPGGPPSLHRPPAFPLFLIPAAVLPESLQQLGVIFLNSFFLGGSAFLLIKFASQFFNHRLALMSVGILILNPWVLWSVKNPTVAIFQMFIVTAFITFIAQLYFPPEELKKKSSIGSGAALGLIGAILALTHGVMLLIVLLAFVFFLFKGWIKNQSERLKISIMAIVVLFMVVSPWTYRNWLVTGRFVPIVGNVGMAYFLGNSHWELGELDPTLDLPENESLLFQERTRALLFAGIDRPQEEILQFFGIRDPDLDAKITQKAIRHALDNPGLFGKKIFLSGLEFYFPAFYCLAAPEPRPMSKHSITTRLFEDCRKDILLESCYFLVLWTLAVIGTTNSVIKGHKTLNVITLLGIIFLISFPYFPFVTFIGHSLYTFSTLPFLSILSALGILCIWKHF